MERFLDVLRRSGPAADSEPQAYRSSQLMRLRTAAEEDLFEAFRRPFPRLSRDVRHGRLRFPFAVESDGYVAFAGDLRILRPGPRPGSRSESSVERFMLTRLGDEWALRALRLHREFPNAVLLGFILLPAERFGAAISGSDALVTLASYTQGSAYPERYDEIYVGRYPSDEDSEIPVVFARAQDLSSTEEGFPLYRLEEIVGEVVERYAARVEQAEIENRPQPPREDVDLDHTLDEDTVEGDATGAVTVEEQVVSRQGTPPEFPRVLIPIDSWISPHGGVPTFNRKLAAALAEIGCEVAVSVTGLTETEIDDATAVGVRLVTAPELTGQNERARLGYPPPELETWQPQVIIGHGDLFGPAAQALQRQAFPDAKRIHVLHTEPEPLAWTKADDRFDFLASVTGPRRADVERDLAASADLVAGVGPRLTRHLEHILRGPSGQVPPIAQILPGLYDWGALVEVPPPERQILISCRADDLGVKGVDIAVEALAYVIERYDIEPMPYLVIRGASPGRGDDLAAKLRAAVRRVVDVRVREYTDDAVALSYDIWQSSVVIMPSRTEGFGLVGLEAIAAGVPVLVSSRSGLAETLMRMRVEEDLMRSSLDYVVPVDNELTRDAERWGEAIALVLRRPNEAFQRAAYLRATLAPLLSWRKTAFTLLEGLGYVMRRAHATTR